MRLDRLERLIVRRGIYTESKSSSSFFERFDAILKQACHEFNVSSEEVVSRARPARVVAPRHASWWVCSNLGITHEEIGDWFGFDRGTVTHGVKSVANRIQTESKFREKCERLLAACREEAKNDGG